MAGMVRCKPWLLAKLLLSMTLERQGFRRRDGVENALLAQAQRRHTRVAQLESAELLFVGVGLLHLLGENGLPQLLAQLGYLVERV